MKKISKYLILCLPPLAIAAAFILRKYIWAFVVLFSQNVTMCKFYEKTGILCPGCGGTRSFIAFMRGDILTSFRCNPAVIIGLVILAALYIETAADIFGKKIKLLPRNEIFWWITGGLFLLWSVLRNFIQFLQP